MAPRLDGSGQTAWSGFHALTVEVRYGIEFNGSFEEVSSTCGPSGFGRLLTDWPLFPVDPIETLGTGGYRGLLRSPRRIFGTTVTEHHMQRSERRDTFCEPLSRSGADVS
jgi:hypothetical protein